jgi:Zn ribbon nucleic-acid-binding protein
MPLDLDSFRSQLAKRGFKRVDPLLHGCPKCKALQGVEKWSLSGRTGGRDIDLCVRCTHASSWRRRPPGEDREEDTTFNPETFLK